MKRKHPPSRVIVGTVVRLTGNNITMKIREGKKQTFSVADESTIIHDGMTSTLDEIQVGQNIRVTTRSRNFNIVVVIESLRNNVEFRTVTPVAE